MTDTYKIDGLEAIRLSERDNLTLTCAANPIDDGGIVTVEKAREIANEDPSLISVTVSFLGWTSDDYAGYFVGEYFDRNGKYLGPDDDGMEPVWQDAPAENSYEIFDGNPSQGDNRWPDNVSAKNIAELEKTCRRQIEGNRDYPKGTRLWYILRNDDGIIMEQGSFQI